MDSRQDHHTPSAVLDKLALDQNHGMSAPRPHWFISRPDGSLSPLIAVDELPTSFRILGVPPVLSRAATVNMTSLGEKERSLNPYLVEMPDSSSQDEPLALTPLQDQTDPPLSNEHVKIMEASGAEPPVSDAAGSEPRHPESGLIENRTSPVVDGWQSDGVGHHVDHDAQSIDNAQVCHHQPVLT